MAIDPQQLANLDYNELGPLVTDPNVGGLLVTHQQAEELRHVESIPVANPPEMRDTYQLRYITNTGNAAAGAGVQGTRLPFTAKGLQVFNGSGWTVYITRNQDADVNHLQDQFQYDFYVPAFSIATLFYEAEYLTIQFVAPGVPDNNLVLVTALKFPIFVPGTQALH